MCYFTRISLSLAIVIVCLAPSGDLLAKGGHGSIKGGGRGFKGSTSVRGSGGVSQSGIGKTHRGQTNPSFNSHLEHNRSAGDLTSGNQPWSKHQLREQRKLDHSRQVADHLREVSDLNGNQQLKQVADDMERRAQAHYDKQMERIAQQYGLDDSVADTGNALDEVADDQPRDAIRNDIGEGLNNTDSAFEYKPGKLTGLDNALARQIGNEQRMLAKRMEAVEQLRQVGEQIGDSEMLQQADRLEGWAMNHFDQRLAHITDFQQRHDLPEVSEYVPR